MIRTFLLIVGIDLVTKQMAAWWLPELVVYNTEISKIGVSSDMHVLITTLLCMFFWEVGKRPDVPGIGMYASIAVGGAIGNLLSYVWDPPGVLDFIDIPGVGVANFADFAIWVGTFGVIYLVARQVVTQSR
jgi:lipoprotein signal peptidase